jgi:outer membrane protein assembly factor BamA
LPVSVCAPSLRTHSHPQNQIHAALLAKLATEGAQERIPQKIIIADVAFEGPIHLPGSSLEPIVTSLKQKEFEVNSKWLEEIENELQNPWQDDGFYRVKIVARAVPLGNEGAYQRYSIAANVEEGLQYRVGRIEFRAEPASNYDRYETASGITVVRLKTSAKRGRRLDRTIGTTGFSGG